MGWTWGYQRLGSRPKVYDGNRLVATVEGADNEAKATAQLLSAAPDLLGALTAILAAYDANDSRGIGEEIERSRAVVSKATKEG